MATPASGEQLREYPQARVIALSVLGFLCVALALTLHDKSLARFFTREGGPIETLSAAIWALSGVGCLLAARRDAGARLDWTLGGIVLLALACRELDFQKRFSDWNLAHRQNYLEPSIPLRERLTVLVLAVLPMASVVLALLYRLGRRWRNDWKLGLPWSRDVFIMLGLLLVSSRLDKFHKVMPRLGLDMHYQYVAVVFEEAIELTIALFVALSLLSAWRRARAGLAAPQ